MSRFKKNAAMRLSGNTKDRPEEKLVHEIIQFHAKYIKLEEQKNIKYITEQELEKDSWVDIYLKDKWGEVIVRIMGEYHDEPRQAKKDSLQHDYLVRDLYKVVDVWYWQYPGVFLRRERKLSQFELETAYKELREALTGVIFLPPKPHEAWLNGTGHKKIP
jgi:hypothetical protein